MRPSWFKISILLAGLWLVVGGTMWVLNERRASPEKVISYAEEHRVAGQSEAARAEIIEKVASKYHQLSVDEQRDLLASLDLKPWWTELTKPERYKFRILLFPKTPQVVEFFDKLTPEQREMNMQKLMGDVQKRIGEGQLPPVGPGALAMVKNLGLKPFVESPLLDEKMETLLMMHELERRLVWRRQ